MSRIVRHLKDNIYQLIEFEPQYGSEKTIHQGTLQEIEAYISLEERDLL